MIRELALERGADVFVRDRKGKRAFDGEKGVGAGDDVSNLLKQGEFMDFSRRADQEKARREERVERASADVSDPVSHCSQLPTTRRLA